MTTPTLISHAEFHFVVFVPVLLRLEVKTFICLVYFAVIVLNRTSIALIGFTLVSQVSDVLCLSFTIICWFSAVLGQLFITVIFTD